MFSQRSMRDFKKDLFNHCRHRNSRNTSQFDYNCAGFALETFSWYCPSHNEYAWGCFLHRRTKEEMEELTVKCVEIMLNDFTDLRVVFDMTEIHSDEYAIAFRVSSDGDFHYMKQIDGEHWEHKCGISDIYNISQEAVLHTKWCGGRYDGPIVLFAKKL